MDLFGKQARKELEALQVKHHRVLATHQQVTQELSEKEALVASINASRKSKNDYENAKLECERKTADLKRNVHQLNVKESELQFAHTQKVTLLKESLRQYEVQIADRKKSLDKEYESKKQALLSEFADLKRRHEALLRDNEKAGTIAKELRLEIREGEKQRNLQDTEVRRLVSSRMNTEADLRIVRHHYAEASQELERLIQQQRGLRNGNSFLDYIAASSKRQGSHDEVIWKLKDDLCRFLTEDASNGAYQMTLESRPLILCFDLGQHNVVALVGRAGTISGEKAAFNLYAGDIFDGIGINRFETLLVDWVVEKFAIVHPRSTKTLKGQKGRKALLSVVQRIMTLLCLGSPEGDINASVTIDSRTFATALPLVRTEMISLFGPLLGPSGEIAGALRALLASAEIELSEVDRIICPGAMGRLPLLRDAVEHIFGMHVLVPPEPPIMELSQEILLRKEGEDAASPRSSAEGVTIVVSSPGERENSSMATKSRGNHTEGSARVAAGAKELTNFTCPVTGIELVLVKGGTFLMGDIFDDGAEDEMPVHTVTVRAFLIGKHQVTQGAWRKIMRANPSFQKGEKYPVEHISWHEAQAFIHELNARTGLRYRLPTEAEWEFAARSGGKKQRYAGGNNVNDHVWYDLNSDMGHHPPGLKLSNELGLFDMSGNVAEWCQDWYSPSYYSNSPKENPRGVSTGEHRVLRGGNWSSSSWGVRTTLRDFDYPQNGHGFYGLRLAMDCN